MSGVALFGRIGSKSRHVGVIDAAWTGSSRYVMRNASIALPDTERRDA
jgi:hypothetical protein